MLLGILLAVGTSACWAIGNVLIQRSSRALGTWRALLWAMVAGVVLAGTTGSVLDRPVAPWSQSTTAWLVVAGVSGLLAYVGIFYAFQHARLSIAVPFVSSWSLVSALLSIVVFGERPRPAHLVGAALVFLGVLSVSVGSSRGKPDRAPSKGSRWALPAAAASAVGFGFMVPALAQVAPAAGEVRASALAYLACVVFGLPLALVGRVSLRPPPASLVPLLLLTGLAETLGFVAVTFARHFAPVAIVSPLASLASTFTVAYAWVVLRERPQPLAATGALLACAGVIALAF